MNLGELCERVGEVRIGFVAAYAKDAMKELAIESEEEVAVASINIVEDQRYYKLPRDYIKILDIRALNMNNDDDEYRSIPRLPYEPSTQDADDA